MDRRKWVFDNLVALSKFENGRYVLFDRLPKRILVWGTGRYGESAAYILEKLHITPLAFLDSDERKHGERFHSIRIVDPLIGLEEYKDACILLAMSRANATEPKKILKGLARKYMDIWDFILYGINKSISILEIGPLYCPMFKGNNVKYLDVYDVPKLREIAKSLNASDEDVPDKIDYVSPNGDWCNINESFDIIYSSHVIEHQTDLIQHFIDVFSHIHSGGAYVLVIPDKRYCFNHYDPETTMEDVLDAFYERRTRHSLRALLRASCGTHNDAQKHWQGNHGIQVEHSMDEFHNVVDAYKSSIIGDYIDCHEWYFTPNSFKITMERLRKAGFVEYSDLLVENTPKNSFEFYACFRV